MPSERQENAAPLLHAKRAARAFKNAKLSCARALYPVTEKWAYFNHASVSPISQPAVDVMAEWTADVAANGCIDDSPWKARVELCRQQLAELINGSPAEIAFVLNTTEGIARVVNGYPWRPQDVVLVPADEYVSNVIPWKSLARYDVSVRPIESTGSGITVDDVRRSICTHTRLLTVSAVHFATGWRADLASIGALCRERGIDLFVDAVQAAGVTPLDVREMQISFLASAGHKWLTGPQGSGFLFVDENRWDLLTPSAPGWNSVAAPSDRPNPPFLDDARRFESGTPALGSLLGLAEAVKIVHEFGIEAISNQVRSTTDYLVDRLNAVDAGVTCSREPDAWSGIVPFRLDGGGEQDFRLDSLERGIAIGLRRGNVRASVHFYNSREDVDRLISAIQDFRRSRS